MAKRRSVPPDVHEMLLAITKVFYDSSHSSLINILLFHTHLTESELVELLGFDYSTLRSILNKLKADKLIDVKMIMTTDQDGKSVNKSFYFINFKQAINSFMYRLECCYKKLEEAQRQDISSGDYKCTECGDTYQDLDILSMYDQEKDCIYCNSCHGLVEAIEDKDKRHSAREEIARFNTKIRNPFIEQFKRIKEQNLADDMIRPEIKHSLNNLNNSLDNGESSNQTSKTDEIMINLNPNATWKDNFGKDKESKENPAWLDTKVNNFQSNNDNSENSSMSDKNTSNQNYNVTQTMAPGRVPGAITTINSSTPSTDIMVVLLANEYVLENSVKYYEPLVKEVSYIPPQNNRFYLQIHGVSKKIWDLSDDDIKQMSEEDISNFMSLGQFLHDISYDS